MARRVPGLQYAMTDANATRFELCAGIADLRARRAVEHDTLFMAASCTEVVAAAAVLQLVDAGRVSLDASLSDHVTEHPYGRDVQVGTRWHIPPAYRTRCRSTGAAPRRHRTRAVDRAVIRARLAEQRNGCGSSCRRNTASMGSSVLPRGADVTFR